MARRNIIQINEDLCTGCGNCIIDCAEGALEIVDGKARLVRDVYCDGLGACLGGCPTGALQVIEREADEFSETAVEKRLHELKKVDEPKPEPAPMACGCPSSMIRELKPMAKAAPAAGDAPASALGNWPLQLHLLPTKAPFYNSGKLLIAADCTGFALTNLHRDFLPGRTLIIACPKLDATDPYEAKLTAIFRENPITDVSLVYMTVPCCFGLVHLVRQAIEKSGKSITLRLAKVDPAGAVVEQIVEKAA